jgi:hypothetical protein
LASLERCKRIRAEGNSWLNICFYAEYFICIISNSRLLMTFEHDNHTHGLNRANLPQGMMTNNRFSAPDVKRRYCRLCKASGSLFPVGSDCEITSAESSGFVYFLCLIVALADGNCMNEAGGRRILLLCMCYFVI